MQVIIGLRPAGSATIETLLRPEFPPRLTYDTRHRGGLPQVPPVIRKNPDICERIGGCGCWGIEPVCPDHLRSGLARVLGGLSRDCSWYYDCSAGNYTEQ